MHRIIIALAALVVACLVTTHVSADTVTRYSSRRDSGPDAGGARVTVIADKTTVERVLLDFLTYKKKFKKFEKVEIVSQGKDFTLIKLEVPTKVSIPFIPREFWAQVEFRVTRTEGKTVIVGKMRDGNLKSLEIRYEVQRVSETATQLSVELLMVPKFPCPSSYLTKELTDAAVKAAKSFKRAAESENKRAP
jgi:hypothetical protein